MLSDGAAAMPNGAVGQLQLHTRPPKWRPASRLTCPRSGALRYRLQFTRQSAEGVAEWCEVVCVRMHAIGMWMVACVCTTHVVVAAPVATPGVTLGCPKAGTHVQAAAASPFRCLVSSSMWCPWLQGHVHEYGICAHQRRTLWVSEFLHSVHE